VQDSDGSRRLRMIKRTLPVALSLLVVAFLCFFTVSLTHSTAASTTELLPSTLSPSQPVETSRDVYYRIQGIPTGPPAPRLSYPGDYGTFGRFQSRTIVWILAQQHNYFGSFVLGVLFLITILEVYGLVSRHRETGQRFDTLAFEWLRLVLLALSVSAITGGIFLIGLLSFYPGLVRYLASIFHSLLVAYGFLLLITSVSVFFYYYTWERMQNGNSKWVHASIGVLANCAAILMMMDANSWATFMMSPSGVDDQGRFLGNTWRVLHNTLWNPLNVHRFFSNILFGAAVVAGYAAYRTITAENPEEKARYNWVGSIAFLAAIIAFFTLPVGGYWLDREIYAYRQQMGITLKGGLLAWVGVMLVTLISFLFLGINYYLWQRIDCSPDGEHYRKQAKVVLLVLTVCVLVYITPHTIVMTPPELKAMGGAQHPVVGNYGVESSKQPAVNIMLIATFWSILVWWKCRYRIAASADRLGSTLLGVLFLSGVANIIYIGIYGYFIPANVRIGLSVPMVLSTLTVIVLGTLITFWTVRRTERVTATWEPISTRANYALLFIAVSVTWIMGIAGYRRSSVRLHWHVNEILRDNSPWAFTNPIGYVGNIISLNVLIFWVGLALLFWLAGSMDPSFSKEAADLSDLDHPHEANEPIRP
jgi:cytochrome d ubiquinol oxidase subunit I